MSIRGSSTLDVHLGLMTQTAVIATAEPAHSLKTQMLRQLRLLGEATPGSWERAVFRVVTGGTREQLDWSYQPNRTGYAAWIATFGQLAAELSEEGSVAREKREGKIYMYATLTGPAS
jgi:hypothetical protein